MIRITLLLAICFVFDDIASACSDSSVCAATKRQYCNKVKDASTRCPATCGMCDDCKDLHHECSSSWVDATTCKKSAELRHYCPKKCEVCGVECKDLSANCKYTSKKNCESKYTQQKCPKTCGICGGECEDQYAWCVNMDLRYCKDSGYGKACCKTCGGGNKGCQDKQICAQYDEQYCHFYPDAKRDCPVMCNNCGEGGAEDIDNEIRPVGPVVAKRKAPRKPKTKGSCKDLDHQFCKQLDKAFSDLFCQKSSFQQNCPKTCTKCHTETCARNNGGCDRKAVCDDRNGGVTCTCKSGYKGNGKTCTDINECDSRNGGCHSDAECTNFPGSRNCACKTGFTGNGFVCTDVDECRDGTHTCAEGFICTNTHGSFACTCQVGFEVVDGACQDVDECRDGTHTCADGFVCQNTPGSFACTCPDGFEVVDGACKALCTNVDVSIKTDEYPKEIAWKIGAGDDCKTAKDKDNYYNKHHVYTTTCCLTVGTHVLQCKDDYGDGWYHKNYATNIEYFGYIEIQGQKYCKERFTKSLTKTVAIKPVATCSDNKKNGDEEGVDCGGSCPACVCEDKPHGLCRLIFEDSHCGIWDILQEHCPSKCLLCEGEARTIICKNTRLGACVEWETLRLDTFADRTVKECEALCAANPECYSFARNRNTRRCNIFKRGCTENVNASDDWYECKDCEDTEDICSVIPFERCEDPNNEYLREKCPRSCRICGGARVQKRAANSSVLMALSNNLKM